VKATGATDTGYYTPAISFVVPEPTLTDSGTLQSGSTITIGGTAFANSSTISATYAGVSVTLSNNSVSPTGTFSGVTFTLPHESAGTYPLVVTDASGTSYTIAMAQIG
jgi:hypothetical protein